ncbi:MULTISPECIES: PHA/PHB synthase family protein [Giesbergeria]|uniref:PHA/PHB synthase family protein n=1 Tax=Giesbergeria sinuosa TaxID=80883 RepID=A0ABV9QBM8_9BURK
MDKTTASSLPFEHQREATKALDETFHGFLSRTTMGLSPIALALAAADWAMHLAASPGRQMVLGQRALALGQQAIATAMSPPEDAQGQPIVDNDNRFTDPSWRQWPFSVLKESYKANSTWWREAVQVDGMSRHHNHMVEFFTRQITDTFTPSNWLLTNPEALNKAQETQGQSLMQGFEHFTEDLRKAEVARSEPEALEPLTFAVGKDVAITPGKVVYRNHLIELIQYSPSTDKVYPEPLLIVPSCIMKYYILDLSPSNSMVRYMVGQGYTVFIISWRNPDASDRDLGMQDYLHRGVMDALAAVKERTGAPRVHALGYCLGGTFLAIVAAAMGRHTRMLEQHQGGARRRAEDHFMDSLPELATVTLLAAQTDFTEPGEMGVFIDDEQLKTLRQQMDRKGYLPGSVMAGSFQFLNMRELVFMRNTRRYLLGQEEADFDLMSWNADLTRLPARMHSEYLSSLFLNNALATGKYRVDGQGIALMDIHAPMLVVGTTRDHVSPWRSVYKIHLQTDTHVTFILAAGGHNAGIVSEPGRPRRSYQINSVEDNQGWIDPDDWVASAPTRQGSWWEAMDAWLKERSGKPIAPPAFDTAHVLCDAPGEYVMVRYVD